MKFKKFMNIKDFFYKLLDKKEYEIDVFLDSYSLNVVIEYVNDGYVLTKKQDKKLKEILCANILYQKDIEKLIDKNLPEKYKYFILAENFIKVFKDSENTVTNMPNTEQWLLKQTNNQIGQNLMVYWKESFLSVIESNKQTEIDKKIQQLKDFEKYVLLLNETDKKDISDFINSQAKKLTSFFKNQSHTKEDLESLAMYVDNLQIKKNVYVNSLTEIIKTLKPQDENKVVVELENIEEKYKILFSEFKDMDKNKRNSIMDLYNKYLINGLKQYIEIKPAIRIKAINNKTAQSIMLENIIEIKNIFDIEVKIIQEQKLMTLSSKSEYFNQLKKQW